MPEQKQRFGVSVPTELAEEIDELTASTDELENRSQTVEVALRLLLQHVQQTGPHQRPAENKW